MFVCFTSIKMSFSSHHDFRKPYLSFVVSAKLKYHLFLVLWTVFPMQQLFEEHLFGRFIETQFNLLSEAILIVMLIR